MTCRDCIHYDICNYHIDEETAMTIEECGKFKNKADYVEVVRCKDCKHRRETAHGSYCLPVYRLKRITDLNAYCSYGQRK